MSTVPVGLTKVTTGPGTSRPSNRSSLRYPVPTPRYAAVPHRVLAGERHAAADHVARPAGFPERRHPPSSNSSARRVEFVVSAAAMSNILKPRTAAMQLGSHVAVFTRLYST
jgi:hypothetical protein